MKKKLLSLALLVSTVAVCNTLEVDIVSHNQTVTGVTVVTDQTPEFRELTEEELAALTEEERAAYLAKLAAKAGHTHITIVTRQPEEAATVDTEPATEVATEVAAS